VVEPRKKPIIGILGGIDAGKTTVAHEFAKLGCAVIDADKIAHELLEQESVKEQIVKYFGKDVLDPSGRINRAELGKNVFADYTKLSFLNKLLHPLVLNRVEELIDDYRRQKHIKAIVLDMPLLVEVGWAKRCNILVFVDCKRELRTARAKKEGLLTESAIEIRENFQNSLDKKAKLADNMIDNNSDFSALVRQVTDIFTNLVSNK
jgi:dephospho-CoA kinase